MEETRVWEYVKNVGNSLKNTWKTLGEKYNLPVTVSGMPCLAHMNFTKYPLELKTLYTVLMLKKGFLATTMCYPTLAHTPEILTLHEKAVDEVFAKINEILKKDSLDEILKAIGGPVCHSGFKRLIK